MMAQDVSKPESPVRVNLFWQALLTATVFGLETSLGFFQIYAILFLQYMGVPVSLLSLDGVVTGVFCISVVPLAGYLTDKGSNPKTRKWLALLFGNGILVLGVFVFFVTTSLNLMKLIDEQEYLDRQRENDSIHLQNSPTNHNYTRLASQDSTMYTPPAYHNSTSSAFLWPSDNDHVEEIPVTAILAILCASLFNIAYDSCASISRAFILVCVPTYQQSGILIMATIFQSLSGTIFSLMGVIDLPKILGPVFGVDGVSVSFLLFAVYMFVCVVASFIITSGASRHIERMFKGHKKFADKKKLGCKNNELNGNKAQSVYDSQYEVSCVKENETIPIISNDNSNSDTTYSSVTRDSPCISLSSTPETQIEDRRANDEQDHKVVNDQSVFPKEKDDTKLRLNKKLVVLSLGHFFGVGGLMSMVLYMPNTLTIGIYHGDPRALPGTEGHALYQKGLKMAALGNLLFYVTFLMMSLGFKRILKFIDTEILHMTLASTFLVAFASLLIFQREALYFVNTIAFGPYRTCLFTTPYLLATKYNQEKQVNTQEQAKNIGKVMALIGILLPLHYFLFSTFMGPVIDKTKDVWFPLYYSFANFCLAYFFFGLLLFWSRMKKGTDQCDDNDK